MFPKAYVARQSSRIAPALLLATLVACSGSEDANRQASPSTLVLGLAATAGGLERPAVEFEHGKHTATLEKDGCGECHEKSASGDYSFVFKGAAGAASDVERQQRFHDACIGCHQKRRAAKLAAGPLTCGECHVDRMPATASRVDPDFDYSLHARHVKAASDKCETCHHVYNEATKKLEYKKGAESACADCHADVDVGKNLSLGHASHMQCINCHAKRAQAAQKAGPVLCVGCHDAAKFAAVERLPEVPRLMRGQPDTLWVKVGEAATAVRFALVAFDHKAHEPLTRSCSTCHHQTLQPCASCHLVGGDAKGGGITLEAAFHRAGSTRSCVGCHRQKTGESRCAGCHDLTRPAGPDVAACGICHSGPAAVTAPLVPPPARTQVLLAALAPLSLPDQKELTIDIAGDDYRPAKMPHDKIIAKLDKSVRESAFASAFHQRSETLCVGCHHHAPAGTRPAPCASCHSAAGSTEDRPGLKPAFHRQCIGCHQRMGIKTGCTDCHALSSPEVRP